MQALELFFLSIKDDPAGAKVLAKEYAKYVIIWIGTTGLLQKIISGLVNGDPYIRKKLLPDGGFVYVVDAREPPGGA
jgi:hypothetical protein